MKLTIILTIILSVNVSASVYSQNNRMNIDVKDKSIREILRVIEKQSQFRFFYNDEFTDLDKTISIALENKSIEDILSTVFRKSEVTYRVMDNNFVVITPSDVAQQQTVTGIVTDSKGEFIPGVNIVVEGSTIGTVSDLDGKYFITVPNDNAVLIFSFVGYLTEKIVVGGRNEINVTLIEDIKNLQEVVVTAFGIKREKKALGYSVQDIKADELTATSDPQLTSALQGKVAGVNISNAGAGAGSSSRVVIRGNSSLSDNNSPLWVIDGIPFDDSRNGSAGIWGGVERAGAAFDINPDDIESVSVLKGANASALYGSRAGNGVILVTTKKGSRGKGLGINYSGSVFMDKAANFLDLQDQYGQGVNGVYDPNGTVSWGPKFEGQTLPSWTGETIPYEAQANRIKDFCRTGVSQTHNVSFTGGNEKGSFRTSVGKDITNGIYKGHEIEKLNFDFRGDYDVNNWLNIDAKVSYIFTEGKNRPEMGYYSYVSYFNAMPMNIRLQDLEPGYNILGGKHVEKLYTTSNASYRNPYFLLAQTSNSDERYRTFGYLSTNIKFTSDLKLRLKYGLDYYRQGTNSMYLFGDNVSQNRPDYNTNEQFFKEENSEFLLTYSKKINAFELGLNAGGNRMKRYSKTMGSHSGLLPDEGNYFLGYGSNITADESFSNEEVQSIYAFGQIGFKSMLYLDVTARNDWSSTLPVSNNSYFYPSFSLSAILSEMINLPSWYNYAKIRGSWAQVGKATSPYSTSQVYTVGKWNFNYLDGSVPNTLVNKDLKPEISSSTEFGFESKMFNGRLGFDITYYNAQTKNQILSIATDQSTGYSNKLINAGLIINKGVEIMLNTVPVQLKDFSLNLNFNFAKNTTLIEELDTNLKEYSFGSINNGVEVVGIEGEKMGDIKGKNYRYDANGKLIVDAEGLPMRTEKKEVIGNIQADWTGSAMMTINYKGLSLNTLVTMQQGGDIFSASEQGAISTGNAARTQENNRIARFVDGVTQSGDVNNVMVSAQKYWTSVSGVDKEFIYDASYMKLKELAFGYSLPSGLLTKITNNFVRSAKVSVVGRNLFYFYKHTPGTIPDGSAYSSSFVAQAFDFSPVPSVRTFGFSLNVGF